MKKWDGPAIRFSQWIDKLVIPGFDRLPVRHVITFVVKGFTKGVLITRASSIAFNLLMALLPASIFLFTLIPFIPIHTIAILIGFELNMSIKAALDKDSTDILNINSNGETERDTLKKTTATLSEV